MRLLTWNVNGIRARYSEFVDLMQREKPDVACLQEIKASPSQVPGSLLELGDYVSYWHGAAGGYSGVSLHLRRELCQDAPVFSHPAFDNETRIVEARVRNTVFASVYVPNGNKNYPAKIAFLKAMRAYVADVHASGAELVLAGDLNVAHAEIDVHPSQRRVVIGQLPEERELFDQVLAEGLVDVARSLEPENARVFTWWPYWRNARERNVGWRLDYVLVSRARGALPMTCSVMREIGTSDHAPVLAELADERG